VEIVGHYNPRRAPEGVEIDTARVNHWLDNGALPSDTVRSLLRRAGILKARHEVRLGRKLQAAAVPIAERPSES
jgi:small subunit ribosomal protein S16